MRTYHGGKSFTFSGTSDLDKVLRRIGTDAAPFKTLYAPLAEMAKRRHRIVHHVDVPTATATVPKNWSIADVWGLLMWLMVVPAFYYKMRIASLVANDDDRKKVDRHEAALRITLSSGTSS